MRNPKILVLDRSDGFAGQVRGVVDDMRPRPEVTLCTRVGSVGDVLTEEGPFDVVVPREDIAPGGLVVQQREVVPQHAIGGIRIRGEFRRQDVRRFSVHGHGSPR